MWSVSSSGPSQDSFSQLEIRFMLGKNKGHGSFLGDFPLHFVAYPQKVCGGLCTLFLTLQ